MNNILHLKYAIEVEKTGSISKAAENLYMGQPQLSKAIKELEESIGIIIFTRSAKGVLPTENGASFLEYAKNIVAQLDELEAMYKPSDAKNQKFDISVPRASCISHALTDFLAEMDFDRELCVNYRETNPMRAIKNVSSGINNLAVIRFQTAYEKNFMNTLLERELKYETICEFEYLLIMSVKSPLADKHALAFDDLAEYTEVVFGDMTVPMLPASEARRLANGGEGKKCISVYERASQLEILSKLPMTYSRTSPVPADMLERYGLAERKCDMPKNRYKDLLIYRRGYHLTYADRLFVHMLQESVKNLCNI